MPQHGAHGVHLGVTGRRVAAALVDLFEDRDRRREVEPGAAIFLGDHGRQIARLCQRLHEGVGIGAAGVEIAPVGAGERLADLRYALADGGVFGAGIKWRHLSGLLSLHS